MKRLLAIALVVLVYGVGFCGTPPRMAPTVPMAPGVTNPGAKNLENPDVPHEGDDMTFLGGDESGDYAFFLDATTATRDGDHASAIVIMIKFSGSPEYPNAHRIVGRIQFDCKNHKHQKGQAYVLNDDGDVVGTQTNPPTWDDDQEGTAAGAASDLACGRIKPTPQQQEAHEKRPKAVEL